jgi:rhodanese-related sulfurtransferase
MKKTFFILLTFVVLSACTAPDNNYTGNVGNNIQQVKFQNINSAKFLELAQNGTGIILDVRTKAEAQQGHIPKAIVIDIYQKNFEEKIKTLPKDSEIYVYCTVGARSRQAAMILQKNRFDKVFNLEAGIIDWARNNYPITR